MSEEDDMAAAVAYYSKRIAELEAQLASKHTRSLNEYELITGQQAIRIAELEAALRDKEAQCQLYVTTLDEKEAALAEARAMLEKMKADEHERAIKAINHGINPYGFS